MSLGQLTPSLPEEAIACLRARWNLTEEMARRRWQREAHSEQPAAVADLRAAALWYGAHGFPVFPCKSRAKKPLTAHGFKDATTAEVQIIEWWRKWPSANIGVPTGAVSGLMAVDIDPRNGGAASADKLRAKHGAFPKTAEQKTGGDGRHIIFRHPGLPLPKTLAEGIDLKGDGGYIVVAPSMHPSGKRYQWDRIEGREALLHPAEPPAWLLESIGSPRDGKARVEPVVEAAEKWTRGERNNRLASVAGTMRRRGVTRDAIEAALSEENLRRCDQPLQESEVRRIADSVARYPPARECETPGEIVTRRFADIEAMPIEWFWPERIARGKVTLIAGNPGLGKSQLTANIAAVVTTGGCWPVDRANCPVGDVLFFSAEDDPADTIRPRLEAAGANLARVHFADGVVAKYTGEGTRRERSFTLQHDLPALAAGITRLTGLLAVVIDPITAYLGDADSHKNADMRALLAPLSELASRYGVAIIGVSHMNKGANTQALMRVSGSLAFVAAARAAFLVAADPDDKARRLFLPMKNNIGPDATGLAFRIEGTTVPSAAGLLKTSRVVWESERVSTKADDVLAAASETPRLSQREECKQWLVAELAEGPVPAADVSDKAEAAGLSWATIRRAADALGIAKRKNGLSGGWAWELPKALTSSEDAHHNNVSILGEKEHLRAAVCTPAGLANEERG